MTTLFFKGIDYADDGKKCGACVLRAEGNSLSLAKEGAVPNLVAIDSPMGLPRSYTSLLRGGDQFENESLTDRSTDLKVRECVANFDFVKKTAADVPRLFNKTGHVRSPAALAIVPGALKTAVALTTKETDEAKRAEAIRQIRRGEALVVEAHPRMFLYSAIEICWRHFVAQGMSFPSDILPAARDYKDISRKQDSKKARDQRKENRRILRDFLRGYRTWMGPDAELDADDSVLETDHLFDAWLCALTAWSHRSKLTWGWRDAGLPEAVVEAEGHMLILRTEVS